MATEPPSFDQSTLVQDVFIQAPLEIQGHIQEEVQGNVQNAIQGNVQVDIQDNTQGVDVPPQADMMTFPEDRKIPSYFTDSSNISTIDSVGAYYDFGELPHIGGPVPNTENGGITSDPGALFNPDNEPFNPLLTESAWDQYGARETIESFFP